MVKKIRGWTDNTMVKKIRGWTDNTMVNKITEDGQTIQW
jgi:hypothetical protein